MICKVAYEEQCAA